MIQCDNEKNIVALTHFNIVTLKSFTHFLNMKKLLLLGFYLMFATMMQAQITLGTGHIPQVGDKLYIGIDSTEFWYDNPDYGLETGEDKNWEFDLIQIETMQVRDYADVSTGTAADNFPDADMVGPFFGGEGYYRHDADGLTLLGYYGAPIEILEDLDLTVQFDPSYNMMPTNMGYGDTASDDYAFHIELINANLQVEVSGVEFTVNSVIMDVASEVDYEADGWGTFTTPYGTWDVLRVVRTEYRHTQGMAELFIGWIDLESYGVDGFGMDTIRTIMFLNDEIKEPIIEFEIDNDGPHAANSPAQAIRFKIPAELVDVETPDVPQVNMDAFPNPAVNDVSITTSGFEAGQYRINVYLSLIHI